MRGRGPVSKRERAGYRARLNRAGDDALWARPSDTTAAAMCRELEIDPGTLTTARNCGQNAERVASQAFVVALDTVLDAGERGTLLTLNLIVDALARRWSVTYKAAHRRGATVSYDMSEPTLRATWRELIVAGVNVPALWGLLIRQTASKKAKTPPHPQLARLYKVSAAAGKGHAHGRHVSLQRDTPDDIQLRKTVTLMIQSDPHYRRQEHRRLLLAKEDAPPLPTRQDVCAEVGYNVVRLNQRSREVIDWLEEARVRFYVNSFREDYETIQDYLATRQPQTRGQRYGREAVQQALDGLREVYEETARLSVPPDRWHIGPDGPEQTGGDRAYIELRSRFFRALNRRFHAADFWPEHVPAEFRARWFGLAPIVPPLYAPEHLTEEDQFLNDQMAGVLVERDISSSQTQLLAAFLGLRELEELAGCREPKFKIYLARRLWEFNENDSAVLADGYGGPDDARLVAFMKEHWMRRNYGGKISEIVRELAREPETYGPGWRCNVFEPGGVQAAEAYVTSFLASLPSWSTSITAFLDACACIAENADDYRGIVFTDPLDDAEVRWNPVERATKKLPFGPYKLEVRLPGRTRRHRFTSIQPNAAGEFRVNRRELGQLVAPCLAHMLDAYFNGLVLGELRWEGIVNIVAIHDGWFVPAFHDFVDRPGSRPGQYFLDRAIEYAGQSWLTGLGKIYEQFIAALTGTRYERFALDIRDLWRDRVTARRWPKFAAN